LDYQDDDGGVLSLEKNRSMGSIIL